jgi:hypothetical protein
MQLAQLAAVRSGVRIEERGVHAASATELNGAFGFCPMPTDDSCGEAA